MVSRFFLFFLSLFTLEIFSESKIGIESLGYGSHVSEDFADKSKKTNVTRNSSFYFAPSFYGNKKNDQLGYDFKFLLPIRDTMVSQLQLYSDINSYLSFEIKNIKFIFGRKEFYRPKFFSSRDGVEGIKLEYSFKNKIDLEFIAFDYYRGFPLLEYEFGLKPPDSQFTKGNRSRHGVGLIYNSENIKALIRFTYLNLGNFGRSSIDDKKKIPNGDDDFIYHGGFEFLNVTRNLDFGISANFTRGIDKSVSNPERKEKSIPISGEQVTLFANLKLNVFNLAIASYFNVLVQPETEFLAIKNKLSFLLNSM